jgi:NitT/TauT family transport system ATP-binding protein
VSGAAAPILALREVGMVFEGAAGRHAALGGVSLEVAARDLVAIVGESGCGKTTLLRIMAGLQRPTSGEVRLAGMPVVRPEPQVCLVFQNYAATLLPWKDALGNVLFGLRAPRAARPELREVAVALLARMGLGDAARRFPWELSGGMQQRVALARALIRRPRVLLLDEPFSAVDERTAEALRELLQTLYREESCSIVLVTHDLEEVLSFSRRIVVLGGRPTRVDTVIDRPDSLSRETLRSRLRVVGKSI